MPERCSELALTSFECVIDDVRTDLRATAYLLGESLRCPGCESPIIETTLVQLKESCKAATFDRPHDMLFPRMEIVLIDEISLVRAQRLISACEICAEEAQITFDYLLDAVTGCNPSETEYLMCRRAKCPCCFNEVTEKTLVIPE